MIKDVLQKNGDLYVNVLQEEIANTALPKYTKANGLVYSTTIASGKLNKSMVAEVTKITEGYNLSFLMLHYAKFLDRKRYPKVPINVLLDWMRSKGIAQDKTEKEKLSIAWAIHFSLKNRGAGGGTVPEYSPFLTENLDEFLERTCEDVAAEVEKEIDDSINKAFEGWQR